MNLKASFQCLMVFIFGTLPSILAANPYVTARLWGRFGNQLFIIAAATSLALENGVTPTFPDFAAALDPECNLKINYDLPSLRTDYEKIFYHLNVAQPIEEIEFYYKEPSFTYAPIPYQPNMIIEGWFQSEKYFINHKKEIIDLFGPSPEILQYLKSKYSALIKHPKTVSIHLRNYYKENPNLERVYPTYGKDYVEKAISLFPEDSLFVVFSDQISWCKEQLAGIPRNIHFIEGEKFYHDFYLMSMCKHHIICNSTFSWWAAYLNKNPDKIVVAPQQWFSPEYNHNSSDLIPEGWITIN